MATTTTELTESVYAEIIERDAQRELRPHRVFRPWLRQGPKGNSTVFSFLTVDDSGSTDTAITEASTDLISSTTDITTSEASATAAQTGIGILISDLVQVVSVLDVAPLCASVAAAHMGEAYDGDAQAVIDGYTNSTGGATTNTLARMLTVLSALEARDVGSRGERLVGALHPKQAGDLRLDVASLQASFIAGPQAQVGSLLAAKLDGYVGDPFGVPLYQSSTVTNASSAHQGWIMAVNSAVGAYELWELKIEMQRDASKLSDEIIASMCVGFAIIDNNRLQGWKSTT